MRSAQAWNLPAISLSIIRLKVGLIDPVCACKSIGSADDFFFALMILLVHSACLRQIREWVKFYRCATKSRFEFYTLAVVNSDGRLLTFTFNLSHFFSPTQSY